MTLFHKDTSLRHNDTSLRHNDTSLKHNDTGLHHNGGVEGGGGTVAKDDADSSIVTNTLETTRSASVTIGSGTNRKVIGIVALDDANNGFTSHSVKFDPGGADEVNGTQITGAAIVNEVNDLHMDAFLMDIPDGVDAGAYSVQVQNGTSVRGLSIGAFALSTASNGQPEAVETSWGVTTTTFDTSITTLTDGAMLCEHVVVARNVVLSPDDGQTEEYNDNVNSTETTIAGATTAVPNAGSVDTGWSWDETSRYSQVAIAVAPAG